MKIQSLKPSSKVKGRYLITLDEGTILRVSQQELIDFSLYEGKELSCAEAESLEKSAVTSQLKNKAYALVTRKPVSRADLAKKLKEWEATEDEITEICDKMEDLGLVNDEEYAKLLADHYHRKGYGGKKIQQEFYQHGVPREFWEDALESLEDNEEAIDKFLQQKLKGDAHDPKQLKKVSDALARRGFSWSEIRAGVLRYDESYSHLWEE